MRVCVNDSKTIKKIQEDNTLTIRNNSSLPPFFLLIVLGLLSIGNVWAASFDCNKATTEVERLICTNLELAQLDEKMAEGYQTARTSVTNPQAVKAKQLKWLSERNGCNNIACLKQSYGTRIAQLEKQAVTKQAADVSKPKPRYRLVAGMGYSICETYLKHLNTLSPDAPPMVCNIRPNPAYNDITRDDWDITQPEWEELDVQQNLNLIYAAEMQYPPYSVYRYDPNKDLPTFEEWKAEFEARIAAGKIHPKLYRTRLALNEKGGVETLIGYEPDPDDCERNLKKYNYTNSDGKHIFVLNDDPQEPLKTIHGLSGSNRRMTVLYYRDQSYFAWAGFYGSPWGLELVAPSTGTMFNQPKEYVLHFRCRFESDKTFK